MSDPFLTPSPYGRPPEWYGRPAAYGPGLSHSQTGADLGQPVHPLYGPLPPTGPVYLPPQASPRDAFWDGRRAVRVLASPGRRFLARLLDGVISSVGFFLIILLFVSVAVAIDYHRDEPGPVAIFFMILGGLVALAWLLLYDALSVYRWGGTLGKLVVGLTVVRLEDGWRWPGLGRSVGRQLLQGMLGLTLVGGLLDALWPLWNRPLHQCLHDKVARTVVVLKEGMPVS